MMYVFAKLQAQEGHADRLRAAVRALAAASQAEAGCEEYTAYVSNTDPTVIRIKERWRDPQALQAHMAAPHFVEFGERQAEILAGPIEVDLVEPA